MRQHAIEQKKLMRPWMSTMPKWKATPMPNNIFLRLLFGAMNRAANKTSSNIMVPQVTAITTTLCDSAHCTNGFSQLAAPW